MTEDGASFVTVGDGGQLVFGTVEREDGRITGLDFDQVKSLHTPDGRRVTGLWEFDAEGVALSPERRLYVAFEQDARVWAYDAWLGPAIPLPRHPDFAEFPANGGLEALAIGPDGALYALSERSTKVRRGRAVYRYRNGAWSVFGTVGTSRGFWPVGADVGPDGRFYLLERRYLPFLGFATRVRRFGIGAEGLEAAEVLLETGQGRHGNLEGIAVWEDPEGGLRITMIADDDDLDDQRTELVDYAVPGGLEAGGGTR